MLSIPVPRRLEAVERPWSLPVPLRLGSKGEGCKLIGVCSRSLVGCLCRSLTGACALCGVLIDALRACCLGLLARRERRGLSVLQANIGVGLFLSADRRLNRLVESEMSPRWCST